MDYNQIYRPQTLDEVVGQEKAKNIISKMIQNNSYRSMIFAGQSGSGKTTMANIIALNAGMKLFRLNATLDGTSEIKDILKEQEKLGKPVLLFVDELQYYTTKQQQILLDCIESGKVILIGSTADNPFIKCYKALVSRCLIIEFTKVSPDDIKKNLERIIALSKSKNTYNDDVLSYISMLAGGDVRNSVKILQLCEEQYTSQKISIEDVKNLMPDNMQIGYNGADSHYDLLGCLQKSIRGSDVNAAIFYLAKGLSNGDLLGVCRRLRVIASEDVGLANPIASIKAELACQSAEALGFPECAIPLQELVAFLALSPKSNSAHIAYSKAMEDVEAGLGLTPPEQLKSPLFKNYVYPHDYINHWVKQQYLPEDLKDRKYYEPSHTSGFEKQMDEYWKRVKQNEN